MAAAFTGKQAGLPADAEAGWRPWGSGIVGGNTRRVREFLSVYGGTDNSVTWVFSCATRIAERLAGYERQFVDRVSREPLERADVELELLELIDEWNSEQIYEDAVTLVGLDLELVGNSYWLKDEMNMLEQPRELRRLPPEDVTIAVDRQDRKVGYVYRIRGRDIPFGLDEIVHYKNLPHPGNPHYGMGTVEGIIRDVETELSQTLHVNAFFENGGILAGILSTPEFMPPDQFERLERQIRELFGNPSNAYRILLAEGTQGNAPSFDAISTAPPAAGIVDLRRLSKDIILSGFGVPAPILGGILENANYKMEEAQHIFASTMTPKSLRYAKRTELDVTAPGWDVGFGVKVTTSDPQSVKIERGKNMAGTGASLRMIFEEMGKEVPPELGDFADAPLLPNTLVPWGQNGPMLPQPGVMSAQAFANFAALSRLAPAIETLAATIGPEKTADLLTYALDGNGGGASEGRRALPFPKTAAETIAPPELPEGFERRAAIPVGDAEAANVRFVLDAQARFITTAYPRLRQLFQELFADQREAVLELLAQFGSQRELARARMQHLAFPVRDVRQLTPRDLWDEGRENARLRQRYLSALDELGPLALEPAATVARAELRWDLEHEKIAEARERLAEQVTRVNETTRRALADEIEIGMRRGYTVTQIANGFPDHGYRGVRGVFEMTDARAETIARTETAYVYNRATEAGYREADVTHVHVIDGPGCGWTSHDDMDKANGSTRTLDEFAEHPIAHPNCVRAAVPLGVPPVQPAPGRPAPEAIDETPEKMLLPEWAEQGGMRAVYDELPDGLQGIPRAAGGYGSRTERLLAEGWTEEIVEADFADIVPGAVAREQMELTLRAGEIVDEELTRRLGLELAERGLAEKRRLGALRIADLEEQRLRVGQERAALRAEVKQEILEDLGYDVEALWSSIPARPGESLISRAERAFFRDGTTGQRTEFLARVGTHERLKAVKEAHEELNRAYYEAVRELRAIDGIEVEARRRLLLDILGELRPMGIDAAVKSGPRTTTKLAYETLGQKQVRDKLEEATDYYPRSWLEASNELGMIDGVKLTERGFQRFDPKTGNSTITLSEHVESMVEGEGRLVSVAVHELAHRMENAVSAVKALEWTFFEWRARGRAWNVPREREQRIADLIKGYGGHASEIAIKDEWHSPYMGRVYARGEPYDTAFEILSEGMQDITTGTVGAWAGDTELRRFLLGLLALA